jgi:D-aspartate ligase
MGKVLIVGAEENPSLPIIHSLARQGLEVHVASHKSVCVGFYSRYAHKRFLYPSPFTDENGFVNQLLDYIKKEKFEVTFATGDIPTCLLSKNKKAFSEYTRLPLVDFDKYIYCMDKTYTMKIAEDIGVPIPKTYYPEEEDIDTIASKVSYPIVVKPNISDGARGITYPRNKDELIHHYCEAKEKYGACHIQEYIPHTGMQYKAELLLDYSSEVKAWCVYRKIRYYPPSGGSSTLNATVDRKDILESGAKILKEMRWYGMGDCDFIEDPRDGTIRLMEINPRFTRSIKICSLAGVDFPLLLYKMALGENIPWVLDYQIGTYLRYLPGDLMWFVKSSNRFKTKPSFFWFLGKNLRYELFSLKDPGPTIGYCLSMAGSMLDKKERQFRLR